MDGRMSKKKSISFFLVFLLMLTGAFSTLNAQDSVIIIQADRLDGGIVDGGTIRKILGDVILQTEDMIMETDSVYQYVNRNLLIAFNSQIETENEMIWADTLYHNTETEFSRMRGKVIV